MSGDIVFTLGNIPGVTFDIGSVIIMPEVVEAQPYTGEYEVTPTTEDQTLYCKKQVMRRNITVCAVPCRRELNESGGYTVSIAPIG